MYIYISIYIYVYLCLYIYIYIYIHTYLYEYIYVYTYIYVYMYMHIFMDIRPIYTHMNCIRPTQSLQDAASVNPRGCRQQHIFYHLNTLALSTHSIPALYPRTVSTNFIRTLSRRTVFTNRIHKLYPRISFTNSSTTNSARTPRTNHIHGLSPRTLSTNSIRTLSRQTLSTNCIHWLYPRRTRRLSTDDDTLFTNFIRTLSRYSRTVFIDSILAGRGGCQPTRTLYLRTLFELYLAIHELYSLILSSQDAAAVNGRGSFRQRDVWIRREYGSWRAVDGQIHYDWEQRAQGLSHWHTRQSLQPQTCIARPVCNPPPTHSLRLRNITHIVVSKNLDVDSWTLIYPYVCIYTYIYVPTVYPPP